MYFISCTEPVIGEPYVGEWDESAAAEAAQPDAAADGEQEPSEAEE